MQFGLDQIGADAASLTTLDAKNRARDGAQQIRNRIHRKRAAVYENHGKAPPPMRGAAQLSEVEDELAARGEQIVKPAPTETPAERDSRETIERMEAEGTVDPFTLETKKRTGSVR
jgi:hypothetical protein